MRLRIAPKDLMPEGYEILPPGAGRHRERMERDLARALRLLEEATDCQALVSEISRERFWDVFTGEGQNDAPAPLEQIFPRAERLALFALTLGGDISDAIEDLFRDEAFVCGYFLDRGASLAVERAVQAVERTFLKSLQQDGQQDLLRVLSYSPGYCGWHISGQKSLFAYLLPGELGVTLTGGLLMEPLKSATGVLVAAEPAVHFIETRYPCCRHCGHRTCEGRYRRQTR